MEEFYWTINGNRWVKINGKIFEDFLPMNLILKGHRKTPAVLYLEILGFLWEEAEEYLSGLCKACDADICPECFGVLDECCQCNNCGYGLELLGQGN